MRRAKPFLWASLLGLALVIQPVQAQSQISNPGIQPTGTIAVNDCVKFVNPFLVTSTGAACAGATAPGGSTTQLQYNNASAFGGVSGWTTNGTTALTGGASTTVAIGGATIGSNALAVTGTANISGNITTAGNVFSPGWNTGGFANFGFIGGGISVGRTAVSVAGDQINLYGAAGNVASLVGTQGFTQASSFFIAWGSGTTISSPDLYLYRDAAGTLAQRNSTTAQRTKIFNTWTDASNGEWFEVDWITNANVATIGTNKNGAGATRNLRINIGGANQLDYGVTTASVWTTPSAFVTSATTDSTTTTSGALQVAGGAAIRKRVFIDGITTSSGVQTAVLCQSSGGEMIADSVACLASAGHFKDIRGPMPDGALAKIALLPIDLWSYKPEGKFTSGDWTRERIGPIADDVAAMDPRLAGYDGNGNVRTYSTEQLLAYTIKALQELKADNDNLRTEVRKITR